MYQRDNQLLLVIVAVMCAVARKNFTVIASRETEKIYRLILKRTHRFKLKKIT